MTLKEKTAEGLFFCLVYLIFIFLEQLFIF